MGAPHERLAERLIERFSTCSLQWLILTSLVTLSM